MATDTQMNTDANKQETDAAPKESGLQKRMPLIVAAGLVIVVGGTFAGLAYWGVSMHRISIDKASLDAPQVVLSADHAGTLNKVYVSVGDTIAPNTVVAEVGTELVKSGDAPSLVIAADNDLGAQVAAGTPVVTVIDPSQLRVVGQVAENKGFADIKVGDAATFTVDAFGGKTFQGVVDEVSPTSHESGVVFNISDQRQTQNFDVKVSFDSAAHPELKNGMSARLLIYLQQ